MLIRLEIPHIEPNILGGAIIRWHKQEGDWIGFGDDLFDLRIGEVNKEGNQPYRSVNALVRVTSSDFGYLRNIQVHNNVQLPTGQLVAVLSMEEDEPLVEDQNTIETAPTFRVVTNFIRYQTEGDEYQ